MLSFLVKSFLQLLSFILNSISYFPTYCILHFKHSSKCIKVFNNVSVVQTSFQKCLGVCLDKKLNFSQHIKEKVAIANKRVAAVVKQLQTKLL